MNKPEFTGQEKVMYRGSIFEIVRREMKIGNKTVEFEMARRAPGVRLIIVKEDKILLTKEFRNESNDFDYRLPGGKVFDTFVEYEKNLGEECKEEILDFAMRAAKKECEEETGLIPQNIRHYQMTRAGATVVWDLFYFLVDDFLIAKKPRSQEGELIFPEWKTFSQVRELCMNNKIQEDRTVGVLLKFLSMHNK